MDDDSVDVVDAVVELPNGIYRGYVMRENDGRLLLFLLFFPSFPLFPVFFIPPMCFFLDLILFFRSFLGCKKEKS